MGKIRAYYSIFLFISVIIFVPINNTLLNLDKFGLPTLGTIIPIVIFGIVLILFDFKKFIKFIVLKTPLSLLFVLTSSLMLIVQSYVLNYASHVPSDYLFVKNTSWFVYISIGFILAFYFDYWMSILRHGKIALVIGSFLGISIFLILLTEFSFSQIVTRKVFTDVFVNYQLVSDLLVIGSFLLLAKYFNRKIIFMLIIITITIIMLLILGSRSSIVFFSLSVVILHLKNGNFKINVYAIIFGVVSYVMFYDFVILFFSDDARITSLLTGNYEASNSYIERDIMLETNMKNIKENWFTGNIYGEFLTTNTQGTYIHNYLSYLQNFGFLPFAILNLILVRVSYLLMRSHEISFKSIFIFLSFSFTLISMLISRSYTAIYFMPFLIIAESFVNRSLINKKYKILDIRDMVLK